MLSTASPGEPVRRWRVRRRLGHPRLSRGARRSRAGRRCSPRTLEPGRGRGDAPSDSRLSPAGRPCPQALPAALRGPGRGRTPGGDSRRSAPPRLRVHLGELARPQRRVEGPRREPALDPCPQRRDVRRPPGAPCASRRRVDRELSLRRRTARRAWASRRRSCRASSSPPPATDRHSRTAAGRSSSGGSTPTRGFGTSCASPSSSPRWTSPSPARARWRPRWRRRRAARPT